MLRQEDTKDFSRETNAAINNISSGGPLIDLHGKVIGINTIIATNTIGYSRTSVVIPINMVKKVVEDLITYGKVLRGWLGVTAQAITSQLQKAIGLENKHRCSC